MVWFGVAVVLLTEFLSLFHLLRPWPLAVGWLAAIAIWWKSIGRSYRFSRPALFRHPVECALGLVIAGIAAVAALTAIASPPNSADAMAYHLPRVVYWAQSASVAFFRTPYFNQVMLQPMAEYLMLHTYLLTGGDRLVNLIACGAFGGCIVGVSAIAAAMGL